MTDENANQTPSEPEEAKTEEPEEAAAGESAEQEDKLRPMPPADFSYLIQTFYLQALINTGNIPNPVTQTSEANPELAKFNISMMEILQEKTKGNLNETEQKLLGDCLHQVRMAFVDIGKDQGA
jgi:hypothetical protein